MISPFSLIATGPSVGSIVMIASASSRNVVSGARHQLAATVQRQIAVPGEEHLALAGVGPDRQEAVSFERDRQRVVAASDLALLEGDRLLGSDEVAARAAGVQVGAEVLQHHPVLLITGSLGVDRVVRRIVEHTLHGRHAARGDIQGFVHGLSLSRRTPGKGSESKRRAKLAWRQEPGGGSPTAVANRVRTGLASGRATHDSRRDRRDRELEEISHEAGGNVFCPAPRSRRSSRSARWARARCSARRVRSMRRSSGRMARAFSSATRALSYASVPSSRSAASRNESASRRASSTIEGPSGVTFFPGQARAPPAPAPCVAPGV